MAIFEKKLKKMEVDEIAELIKTLPDDDLNKLLDLLQVTTEDTEEEAEEPATEDSDEETEEAEASENAEDNSDEETPQEEAEEAESEAEEDEETPETTDEAEEQRDAQEIIDALTARIETQDEVIANLTERIDNIVAQLDDKPFGGKGKAKPDADDNASDDAIMRSYNRSYRK